MLSGLRTVRFLKVIPFFIFLLGKVVEARGLKEMKFIEGAELSSMKELTQGIMKSDG
jgi:hypothetical protein